MMLRNLSGKHFSSISRRNLAKSPNEVKTKGVLPGAANEEKSRRLNLNRYLRKDASTDKNPHNSRPLISAGRLNRQIKVEPNIGQSGEIYSVAGRIIRNADDRKTFGGSIAAQMSATARYRQTRAATEETSVINPLSLSIPLDESPHQPSDTSTQVVTNKNLAADSNNRECASEKSSNKLGKVVVTENSRNTLGKVGTVVLAGSAGLTYFYLFS